MSVSHYVNCCCMQFNKLTARILLRNSTDSFETRIARFQEALLVQYNELISEELDVENGEGSTGLGATLQRLRSKSWEGMQHTEPDDDDSLLTFLLDFREQVKASERKLVAAHSAYESLASLTASNSALVALDNTRKLLFSISSDDRGPLFETIENTHELLNKVEVLLHDCARSIDGDSGSLISMLEKVASTGISVEVVDSIIADWNALARKHGITVSVSCQPSQFCSTCYKADFILPRIFSRNLCRTVT